MSDDSYAHRARDELLFRTSKWSEHDINFVADRFLSACRGEFAMTAAMFADVMGLDNVNARRWFRAFDRNGVAALSLQDVCCIWIQGLITADELISFSCMSPYYTCFVDEDVSRANG